MAFAVPTLDEIHGFLIALFKALFPDRNAARRSFHWKWLRVLAAAVTDNHAHVRAVERDLWPDTSEGDALEHWGRLLGVEKKGATEARKANALRVVGVVGAAVPDGAELTHDASGLRFKVAESGTIPAGGYLDVDVVAIDKGDATRLSVGEDLRFDTAPPGLEETARLVLDLDEDGEDKESDGAYRLRVLSRFSDPPLGGAQEDYRQWALETLGIADAYVYPTRRGFGSVDLAALHAGTGTARILSSDEAIALRAALDALRPVATKGLRVLSVFAEPVDVEVTLFTTGDQQYEFDWNDAVPLVVSTWDGVTRVLTFTTSRPDTMEANQRLTIETVGSSGAQSVIESLSSTAAVVLEASPDIAPAPGDLVYAGSPLVDPVRDALIAHINSLGTANPDARRYGTWEGSLRPGAINRIATAVPGVLDAPSIVPSATVSATDPPYPDDDTIGLLIPGRVIVRRDWPSGV